MVETYKWLNPPPGVYSIEEYLKMHAYWMQSTSCDRNKLALRGFPLKNNFFGNTRVTVTDVVTLEALT